jgi:phosphate transport system ATP-binding protein
MNNLLKFKMEKNSDSEGLEEQLSILEMKNFNVWIKAHHILKDINLKIKEKSITGIIGPSGGGKSTLIKSFNRINDEIANYKTKGNIYFKDQNIYDKKIQAYNLRKKIGMIFQNPCVFPKSIHDNVLFGVKHFEKLSPSSAENLVETCLKDVSLWNEVKDRLHEKACNLSIGQQQRLCIARAIALTPDVLLMDEPTSALDPLSTLAIEELILKLQKKHTIVLVTHNIEQAKRIVDDVLFICGGEFIEQGTSEAFFSQPQNQKSKDYLNWEVCDC